MKYTITTKFGSVDSWHSKPHTGIDFAMEKGTPIHSVSNGTITLADYGNTNAGRCVLIEDENGRTFIYGHLSKFANFHNGQKVHSGDVIGYAGSTGHSSGNHLHFGMRDGWTFKDPSPYISKIEHMNDKVSPFQQPIQHHATQLVDSGYSFKDMVNGQMNVYSDLFHHLKLNLIQLFHSIDYTSLIHHFQNLFNLFFG